MVGVPGRSKGCATCRRRKKGCDLKRPECSQCTQRGLICGGYDEDRIFVDQNSRFRDSSSAFVDFSSDRSSLLAGKGAPRAREFQKQNAALRFLQTGLATGPREVVLPDSLARSAYCEKSIEMFRYAYAPSSNLTSSVPSLYRDNKFADLLPRLYVTDDALRTALLALSSATASQDPSEPWKLQQAKKLYSKALHEMAKAVKNPQRARSDGILAVPRVMGLFEILYGSDIDLNVQARSWRSHAEGELALMKARNPADYADGTAHDLFVEGRSNPIIAAIRTRKATILNTPEWKTLPWATQPKSPRDSLLDVLAGVPEILEIVEMIPFAVVDNDRGVLVEDVRRKASALRNELHQWSLVNPFSVRNPEVDGPIPITFPDLSTGYLSVMYWATGALVYHCLSDPTTVLNPNAEPSPTSSSSAEMDRAITYAQRITRSVEYFFGPGCGIVGATMIAFPTGVAMLTLKCLSDDKDYAYMGLVQKAWSSPNLPTSIRKFLLSMRQEAARS